MSRGTDLEEDLAKEILELYRSDAARAEVLIESCLARELRAYTADEKLACLEGLIRHFSSAPAPEVKDHPTNLSELSDLFSLLLGKRISDDYLLSREFLEKLADALNTLFDSLNETVGVIDATLLGDEGGAQTIKAIISSNISGNNSSDSLLHYVNKIRTAFLVAQKAFKEAAQNQFAEMLAALDPERIAAALPGGGPSFGFFRKARLFDVYSERHRACQKYLDSGRLMEEMLREFERISQKLYGKGMRGNQ